MKKSLHLFLLVFFALNLNLWSQSIQVIMGQGYVEGNYTDEYLISHGIVKNFTDKEIKFKIRFDVEQIAADHSLSLCYNQCFDVVSSSYKVPGSFMLGPGQTSEETGDYFKVYCYPIKKISDDPITYVGPGPGITKIKVYVTNADDPSDESSFEITFNVKDPTSVVDDNLPSSFGISNLSPNPSNEFTKIDFDLKNIQNTPYIELFDLNGNTIKTLRVLQTDNSIFMSTKDLANGSYFVQLIDGNRKSKVKLLIVQK